MADLDALLHAQNLVPINEHVRAERARVRARNADQKAFKDECKDLTAAFLSGDIDLEREPSSNTEAAPACRQDESSRRGPS